MAHEIEGNNVVWATTPCWHGLGTEMDPKASGIEWMKAANLDWAIHRLPMFVTLPNGEHANVLGQKGTEHGVLVRDHGTNTFAPEDVFGPVGPDWVPVQNEDVFKFMDRFCKAGNMQMETAGSLKGGTEIHLTRKEFDLLWLLASNAGRLVTQGMALEHVWGKAHLEDSHYLRVFIRQLRAKIGDDAGNPSYIFTESGVGYRFASGS